ncbi:toxin regulator [Romboutsia faecis]|uniref:toxin regulator n=1 Tax=Romboutsia faecis TaxID=2764597 RepID=UPI002431E116|nr:toxin regulator [Romboutsia faecis]
MKEYENGNNGIDSEVDADLKEIKNESTEDNNQLRLQRPKKNIDIKRLLKKTAFLIAGIVIGFILGVIGSVGVSDEYENTINELTTKNEEQSSIIQDKDEEIETLKNKVADAEPWFAMKEDEQKAIEEENARKAEEERKAAEAKEKQGYNTGITYKQLARTPDDYVGEKVKFKGKVVQVMEGDGETQIRLAVDGNYDNIIYGAYDSSIVSSRVLEDDYITIMGVSEGLLTYTSTMGGDITIPSVLVQKIDM